MYDIIVVGGGPAGMTAAIYARRAGKSVLVIEKDGFGGQMTHSPRIENYPGFESVSGNELSDKMTEQMLALGADVDVDEVLSVTPGDVKKVKTELSEYEAKKVILAVGVKHRTLGVPGESELEGRGVSYCAVCDGAFFAGKDVAVVGGGNSALQEAVLLSRSCKTVTMIQDLPYLTGEQALIDTVENADNVSVVTGARVKKIEGADEVTGVLIETADGEKTVPCAGVFVAIGLEPSNDRFADVAPLDERGYFSDECAVGDSGIYVAGDCRAKTVRQITTATADGAAAALAAVR